MKKIFTTLLALTMLLSISACGSKKEGEKINWTDIRLHEILPEPYSRTGEIHTNSDTELRIEIYDISESQYNDYIDDCKNNGFDKDTDHSSSSFKAFNEDGYTLNLSYRKNREKLSIQLESPMEMETFQWPKSDIAGLLPVPESSVGKIEWEADYGFVIYVGDTSIEDFNEYADACAEKGFTVEYRRGDDYYYADNPDGYHVSLKYEGNDTMFVRIDDPDETSDTNESTAPEENNVTTPEEPNNTPTSGIRPEFKEAMDSYEEFFDEYAAFMKKYTESGYSIDMLSDYTKFMSQYTEMMEAMDALGEEEMSTEESKYYLDTMNRINQKLIDAAY